MVKKNKVAVKKGGVKSGSSKTIKLSRKLIVFSLIAAAAAVLVIFATKQVGADTMTTSCANKKGECIEESKPTQMSDGASWNVIVVDKKSGGEIKDVKIRNTVVAKTCYPAGYDKKHPNGGCLAEKYNYGDNFTAEDSFAIKLFKMDQNFYKNGKKYKTKVLYFPGFIPAKDLRSMWAYSYFEVLNSKGKVIGRTKVTSPFIYTTDGTKAAQKVNAFGGKTFKVAIDGSKLNVSTVSTVTKATVTSPGADGTPSSKFNLVVANAGNGLMKYNGAVSKRCYVTVQAKSSKADVKDTIVKHASCDSSGKFPDINMGQIDSTLYDTIIFGANDPGAIRGDALVSDTVAYRDILRGGVVLDRIGGTKNSSSTVTCNKGGMTIKCLYNANMVK